MTAGLRALSDVSVVVEAGPSELRRLLRIGRADSKTLPEAVEVRVSQFCRCRLS